MSEYGPIRLTISDANAGRTLADVLEAQIGGASTAEVLAHGGAWIGRERVMNGVRQLTLGDELTISRPPDGSYAGLSLDPAHILYEDADLFAIDKPAGAYVEATPWDIGGHMRDAVEQFLQERDGEQRYVHLAHRLDRDTSGVLLFSKSRAVNPALQASFANGGVRKRYLCRCTGEPPQDVFELSTGHGRGARGQFRVYPVESIGRMLPQGGGTVKSMHTRFTVLRRAGTSALVQAEPLTGRTHQIRLHLAFAGHPLLGDVKYGGPALWKGETLPYHLLHAAYLELQHPRTQAALKIKASAVWWEE